jgi:hypothetical protein
MLVLTRATWCIIPEDSILYSHHHGEPHSVSSQKTAFFIVTTVETSNLTQIFCIHQIKQNKLHGLYSASELYRLSELEKKWEYNETVPQLFIDFKKAYHSLRREVLYNSLIEFGVPMELVWLIILCLTGTYSKVCIGKHLYDSLPIQNGLK